VTLSNGVDERVKVECWQIWILGLYEDNVRKMIPTGTTRTYTTASEQT